MTLTIIFHDVSMIFHDLRYFPWFPMTVQARKIVILNSTMFPWPGKTLIQYRNLRD